MSFAAKNTPVGPNRDAVGSLSEETRKRVISQVLAFKHYAGKCGFCGRSPCGGLGSAKCEQVLMENCRRGEERGFVAALEDIRRAERLKDLVVELPINVNVCRALGFPIDDVLSELGFSLVKGRLMRPEVQTLDALDKLRTLATDLLESPMRAIMQSTRRLTCVAPVGRQFDHTRPLVNAAVRRTRVSRMTGV